MASTTALWFAIESAFSEIEDACVEARAAELALERRGEEARAVRAITEGRAAERAESQREGESPRQARAAELAKDLAFREAHPNGPDLVDLRAKLRKRFAWLKGELAEALSEHEVYYALFPLVVYCDELVASITRGQSLRWEPLQSELYEVDNGGELFYTILDDRLRKDETHPIIFQVFYFCLTDGFLGMYQGDRRKLEEYEARLVARIPQKPVEDRVARHERAPVELVPFPWRYYAVAAAAIVVTWTLYHWLAGTGWS